MTRFLWLSASAMLACTHAPIVDEMGDAGVTQVVWECECWTKFRISSLANEAGPVVMKQSELPQDLLCSVGDPSDSLAETLCSERSYFCDCAECVPTGDACDG